VVGGVEVWSAPNDCRRADRIAGIHRAPAPLAEAGLYARALDEDMTPERARLARLAASATVSPNERMQHRLHPWTSYLVIPLFALANAGVRLDRETLRAAVTSPVTIGIIVALLLGKSVGITGSTLLALRLRLGLRPGAIKRGQLIGGATLAGIGFTVALFHRRSRVSGFGAA
jgi:NhaA family Na+:H+ antiporter